MAKNPKNLTDTVLATLTKKKNTGQKSGNKRQKSGRTKRKCAAYRISGKHEKHKIRDLIRHIQDQPGDIAAVRFLKSYTDDPQVILRAGGKVIEAARKAVA